MASVMVMVKGKHPGHGLCLWETNWFARYTSRQWWRPRQWGRHCMGQNEKKGSRYVMASVMVMVKDKHPGHGLCLWETNWFPRFTSRQWWRPRQWGRGRVKNVWHRLHLIQVGFALYPHLLLLPLLRIGFGCPCPLGGAQARYDAPSFDLLCSTSDFSLLAICCSGVDDIVPFCQHLLPPWAAGWRCQVPMFQGWRVLMYFGLLGVFLYPRLFQASF